MDGKHNRVREACPESLMREVAADLQPAVSELYRALWRISFSRERRSDEQDKELLVSVNEAARVLGCVGFSSVEAAMGITRILAIDRLGLDPPDYFAADLSPGERQKLAAEHFAAVDAELKRALAELPFLITCASAEPRYRAEE
jgi:hypothetical protein